jgi:hypothetical protein
MPVGGVGHDDLRERGPVVKAAVEGGREERAREDDYGGLGSGTGQAEQEGEEGDSETCHSACSRLVGLAVKFGAKGVSPCGAWSRD